MSRAGREESMFIKHSSRMGWNLIGFPFGKFLVPIIRLRDQLLIPDDPGVSLVEILKTDDRVRARRLCRALCRAGVPVFKRGGGGGMVIYCPGFGGRLVFEAFDFSSGGLSPAAERLRHCAELGDYAAVAKLCGAVEYRLDDNTTLVVEGKRRYRLPPGATLL